MPAIKASRSGKRNWLSGVLSKPSQSATINSTRLRTIDVRRKVACARWYWWNGATSGHTVAEAHAKQTLQTYWQHTVAVHAGVAMLHKEPDQPYAPRCTVASVRTEKGVRLYTRGFGAQVVACTQSVDHTSNNHGNRLLLVQTNNTGV